MGELKSTLSFPVILLITINSIMGTGIFFLPAKGAGVAGPMSLIAWAILSVISIYIAMCFGELSSMFPKSGGVYEFCKQAYGSFISFLIGWATLIIGNITIAMLVVGAIRYLNPSMPDIAKIGLSVFFILLFNFMAFKGMQTSSFMLVTFSIITLGSIFGLIIPGFMSMNIGNFVPFFTHDYSAIFVCIFFIAETFFGWETATFLAEETKNPRVVIPRALVWGTSIIAVICIAFVTISLGSINWNLFQASQAPLTDLANLFYGAKGGSVFTILVYLSIIGSVAGWIVSAPRLILALAEDKLFIPQCAKIHHKNNTPYVAIIFQTIMTSILVVLGAGSYELLLELLLPLVLIIYSLTLLAVTILRFKKPDLERKFRVPLGKIGPVVIAGFLLGLIAFWLLYVQNSWNILNLALSFILLGVPVYLLLTYYYNPEVIQSTLDRMAHVKLMTENWNLPLRVRKEVIRILGDIEGKNVLEHGCSVGTLTLDLATSIGPRGKIYATNISKGEIGVLETRLKKNKIMNVTAIHDEHHSSRIHPQIPKIDIFVSVGTLSYTQDIHKIAGEIYDRLPVGGRICILEYIDLYKFLPNAGWLHKLSAIDEIFKQHGFLVRVIKKKGFLWNYLYIYGVKSKGSALPFI